MRITNSSNVIITSLEETLDHIENRYSIARFGNGEFNIIMGGKVVFKITGPIRMPNRKKS